MDLLLKSEIQNLLQKHGVRPSKGLGQNFLISKKALDKIVLAANLSKDDTVLEIGPGLGILTLELAKLAKEVISIEKDSDMVNILKETLKSIENVKVIQGDARQIGNWDLELGNSYKVVANLPFYLTAPLIRGLLESETPPQKMVFLVQKEVAQRICSKPPDMNLLAASIQFYSDPEIVGYVPRGAFWPQPNVDSAIIKIINKKQLTNNKDLFFKIVKAGFSHPRKQLLNNLANELQLSKERVSKWLLENGIQPTQRAETLSLGDWTKLTENDII